jgi:hypothetical protein
MARITEAIKAGTEGLSRQKRYKIIRFRLGDCINCGDPRGDSPFKRVCEACGEERKKLRRKKLGSKAWKPGSPGRPPLKASQSENDSLASSQQSAERRFLAR